MEARSKKTREAQTRLSLATPLVGLIQLYKYCISPLLGTHCRFDPSCSSYAIEALKQHGLLKGACLSLNRMRKCHPWHHGGYDPVPPKQPDIQ